MGNRLRETGRSPSLLLCRCGLLCQAGAYLTNRLFTEIPAKLGEELPQVFACCCRSGHVEVVSCTLMVVAALELG